MRLTMDKLSDMSKIEQFSFADDVTVLVITSTGRTIIEDSVNLICTKEYIVMRT